MKILNLKPVPNEYYDVLNYPKEGKCSDIVMIKRQEADNYYEAAEACFQMIDEAAEYVIKNRAYKGFAIPEYLFDVIEHSYLNNREHPYMIGRFDFAGGIDGMPIKLIEFNADTPFGIFEFGVVQYALTKANGYDPDNHQYNYLFETLQEYFKYIRSLHVAVSAAFTNVSDGEDDLNTQIIMEAAGEIIPGDYVHWADLGIDASKGLCSVNEKEEIQNAYSMLVKMVPFDLMITHDPKMLSELANLYGEQAKSYRPLVIANPFYSLVYQSKALMQTVYEMFSDSPYLLKTCSDELSFNGNYVKKPVFGREGDAVQIMEKGKQVEATPGNEANSSGYIFQDVANFNTHEGRIYQAGVYISGDEACCLGFRRSDKGKKIIVADSDMCGHLLED